MLCQLANNFHHHQKNLFALTHLPICMIMSQQWCILIYMPAGPAGRYLCIDTATVSKLGKFRSPYIACPFQPALASLEG